MSGQGFFMLSDDGAQAYTRAGAFQIDNGGYVVNSEQQRLQVYPPSPGGGFNTGTLSDLRLVTSDSAPNPPAMRRSSTTCRRTPRLPINDGPFDPADPDSYNQSTS
jgi:flagellar hook protein FlgE